MRKAIAIDFDGCLSTDAFPAIGEPNWPVINRAKAEQRAGAGLILWTCREDQLLLDAIAACEGWGLTFDAVNESLPDWIEAFGTRPRKVGASEYWDDKAVRMPDALPPNDPLTLEELRGMDWEPVYMVDLIGGPSWDQWIIFKKSTDDGFAPLGGGFFITETYGRTWLASRRKPEGRMT